MTATAIWDELAPAPEPKRDQYGRYRLLHPETGKEMSFTRATTIASTLADKFGLNAWSERMVAIGLTQRQDLYAQVAACRVDDKEQLNRLVGDAKEAAKSRAGANLGSALHTFTERVDRGEDVSIPSPWNLDIAAYQQALVDAGIEIVPGWVERVLVHTGLQIAGTTDRLVTQRNKILPLIADLKTGLFLDFTEIALQLSIYAFAETWYDLATNTHHPMPDISKTCGLVIHLPAGQATCTLYEVDIAAGWEAVTLAMQVRAWRKRKDLHRPLVTVDPVDAMRSEVLRGRVKAYADQPAVLQVIAMRWPAGVPTFKSDHRHSQLELDQIEASLEVVERQFAPAIKVGETADTGHPVQEQVAPSPAPEPGIPALKDVRAYANRTFKAAHDAAPSGKKRQTADRLLQALIFALTSGAWTLLEQLDGTPKLAELSMWLKSIDDGTVTYTHDETGVSWRVFDADPVVVAWTDLTQ